MKHQRDHIVLKTFRELIEWELYREKRPTMGSAQVEPQRNKTLGTAIDETIEGMVQPLAECWERSPA